MILAHSEVSGELIYSEVELRICSSYSQRQSKAIFLRNVKYSILSVMSELSTVQCDRALSL